MIPPQQTTRHSMHMPPSLVGAVLVLCVLPLLLHVLGVNFGSQPAPLDAFSLTAESTGTVVNALHQVLRGSVTHTILEWSALCSLFRLEPIASTARFSRLPWLSARTARIPPH